MNKNAKRPMTMHTTQSVASQVDLDASYLDRVIQKTFENAAIREVRHLSYAYTNKTILVRLGGVRENKVVVKICVKKDRFPKLKLEADLIHRASTEVGLPVPKIINKDFSLKIIPYPFIIFSFLPGENLADAIIHIEDKGKLGQEIAQIASKIHTIKVDEPHFSLAEKIKYKSWVEIVETVCATGIKRLRENKYSRTTEVERYVSDNIKCVREPEKHTLIHRDIQPQNLHWDNKLKKIVGVFDFESAMSGDYHFEFNFLERMLFKAYPIVRTSFYNTYAKHNKLQENYEQLVRFYEVVRDLYFYDRDIDYGELDRADAAIESIERLIFRDWSVG